MRVIRINGAPDECVEQVKLNLPRIKRVNEFEVYSKTEDVPMLYRSVPDIFLDEGNREESSRTYSLILKDSEWGQEIWIEGANCGYGGAGPSATHRILQLCGIKMDYNYITESEKLTLCDLEPIHDLNFIVVKGVDPSDSILKKCFKLRMTFNNAWEKYRAKEAFECLGYIEPLSYLAQHEGKSEEYYFQLPYSTESEWADYKTNNVLMLYNTINSISESVLEEIIKEISIKYHAEFSVKSYNLMFPTK